ncbi:MAG: SWIM/SEC-C metal-binding protein [Polaribacter sp.]|jgi:SWIM/SEC-C metal-binding protein
MSKFFFDGKASNNNARGQGKVGGGNRSFRLGSKNSPAEISVQTEARQSEVMALLKDNKWFGNVVIDADNDENIKDLGYLQDQAVVTVKTKNIGRNDPCSCGSGKKFKKCCGA